MKALLLFLLCVFPLVSWADTTNPRFFNFQSIMRGDNGELVTDPFIDLEFQITDNTNQILYSEEQKNIQVIRGAVNVLVGEGTLPGTNQLTGGLPAEIFDPRTGSKFLRFQVGANLMGDGIELVSMPYAFWSEQALHVVPDSIGSEEIKDGSIELKDLARSIQFSDVQGSVSETQVPTSLATDAELAAHATAKVAHKASQISVVGPYMAYPAKNVEEIIKALDEKVYLYMINGKEDVAKVTSGTTTALTTHTTATTAHGSDGNVVGLNTLNNAITTHAALRTGVHGLTSSDPNNSIVGTTEPQTLTNKTLQGAILTNPVITGGSFSGNLSDNTVETNDLQNAAVTGDKIADGTITDADISATANITRLGQTIESPEITDGTITDADLSPTAGIADTKLATITSAGKVVDSALSGNVTKLGGSIESGEITDGTITDSDISGTAAIAVSKISGLGGLATLGVIGTNEITDGTIANSDISASAAIDWSKVNKTGAAPGDIGAAPASHAHTDADIPNTITVDFAATAGSAGSLSANGGNCSSGQFASGVDASGNAEGCVAVSVDTSGFVQKSGDTMTGELKVPDQIGIPLNAGNFSVGKALRDHEDRLVALKGAKVPFSDVTGQISDTQVPQYMRPLAFGVLQASGTGCNVGSILGGYNVSSVTGTSSWGIFLPFSIAAGVKLVVVTDDVTSTGSQNDTDHDCLQGFGLVTMGPFGGNSVTVGRCSVAAACNSIPNKTLSFVIYQLP